jgi:hypothetical protein
MPLVPGTISIAPIFSLYVSRICAARPTAFGSALQGTQYSMRTCGPSAID